MNSIPLKKRFIERELEYLSNFMPRERPRRLIFEYYHNTHGKTIRELAAHYGRSHSATSGVLQFAIRGAIDLNITEQQLHLPQDLKSRIPEQFYYPSKRKVKKKTHHDDQN